MDHFSEGSGDSQRVGLQELRGGLKAQIHSGCQVVGWLAKGTCVHFGLSLARDFKGLRMLRPFVRAQGALANSLTPEVQNRPSGRGKKINRVACPAPSVPREHLGTGAPEVV